MSKSAPPVLFRRYIEKQFCPNSFSAAESQSIRTEWNLISPNRQLLLLKPGFVEGGCYKPFSPVSEALS